MSSSTSFRIIATVDSTISDVNRAYSLKWITSDKTRKELTDILKSGTRYKSIFGLFGGTFSTVEKYLDKFWGNLFILKLNEQRGKTVNEQAYKLLLEDIRWLLDN